MSDINRYLPPDPATLRLDASPREPLTRSEAIFAWSLVFNGVLGALFLALLVLRAGFGSFLVLVVPLVGIASGVLALQRRTGGFFMGVLFYLVQCLSYYGQTVTFGFSSGLQFAISFHPVDGETIVVNFFAIFALVYGLIVLNGRWAARAEPLQPSVAALVGDRPPE